MRLKLLCEALTLAGDLVLSGSLMEWGPEVEDSFSLIDSLTVPASARVARLSNASSCHSSRHVDRR